ncbi:hypothetical protein [Propionivibrio sp.]|uniref:hypothetical protein n=1 Tax=Propionivibrio sp. TaxID=2212460 RepID=UPI0025FF5711|nr:hypothetical protein [Propionivibrio sp.]
MLESCERLCAAYQCVIVEGAGSPAEINLRARDIALLESGLRWLEERTGKPVLGVLPDLHGLYLDAEEGTVRLRNDAGRGKDAGERERHFAVARRVGKGATHHRLPHPQGRDARRGTGASSNPA